METNYLIPEKIMNIYRKEDINRDKLVKPSILENMLFDTKYTGKISELNNNYDLVKDNLVRNAQRNYNSDSKKPYVMKGPIMLR